MHPVGLSTHPCPFEDPHLIFHVAGTQDTLSEVIIEKNNESKGKYQILEKRLIVVKGNNIFGLDAIDMCLVPNVTPPPNSKSKTLKSIKDSTIQNNIYIGIKRIKVNNLTYSYGHFHF